MRWENSTLLELFPGSSSTQRRQVSSIFWRPFRCVWGGRRAHLPRELLSGQIPPPRRGQNRLHWLFCLTEPMAGGGAKSEQQIQGGLCPPFKTRGAGGRKGDGEGDSEPNSPKGVSGGEVSRDGQVTPHLLPTPDRQAQLQTRLGAPQAGCSRPP